MEEEPKAVCAAVYAEHRNAPVERSAWAHAIIDLLDELGLTADRVSGKKSLISGSFSRDALVKRATDAADFNIYAGRCEDCPSNLDMLDWALQAGLEGAASQLRLSINSRFAIAAPALLQQLLTIASRAGLAVYAGYATEREYAKGPDLFQLGLAYGIEPSDVSFEAIGRWAWARHFGSVSGYLRDVFAENYLSDRVLDHVLHRLTLREQIRRAGVGRLSRSPSNSGEVWHLASERDVATARDALAREDRLIGFHQHGNQSQRAGT
jgi:hypothetical protein